jgi:4-amino-4-deoxy-L-arabinose transferase-like glycosyltransferase
VLDAVPPATWIVLTATLLLWVSWSTFRRKRQLTSVILLLAAGLLLRWIPLAIPHLHAWDERYHALVAKNMLHAPFTPVLYPDPELPHDPNDWSKGHLWLHKPPLTLWMMAGSMKVLGVSIFAIRLPSLLLSLALILLCYDAARRLFDPQVGWLAAALCAINGLLIQLSAGAVATDHVDNSLIFFTTLSIWAAIRWRDEQRILWAALAGCAMGAAILSKWVVGFFPLLIIPLLWWELPRRKAILHGLLLVGVALAVALPWEFHINLHQPELAGAERAHAFGHVDRALEDHGQPWWYHVQKLGALHGELVYLALAGSLWLGFRRDVRRPWLVLAAWALLPVLIFSFATTKMQAYPAIGAPAIFILIASCAFAISERSMPRGLKIVLLAGLLGLPVRAMVERVKPLETWETPEWMERIDQLPDPLPHRSVHFNEPHAIELMFHRNVTAYERAADPGEADALRQRGYQVHE